MTTIFAEATWREWLLSLTILLAALLVGRYGARLLAWVGTQTKSQHDDRYWRMAGVLWWVAVVLATASLLTRVFGVQFEPFRTVSLLAEQLGLRGLLGMLILALALLAYQAIPRLLSRIPTPPYSDTFTREQVRLKTLKGVLESGLRVLVIVLGGIFFLSNLGFNVTALLAGVSVAGLAISFAAQNLVRDLINGFFIVLEDQYGVGDVITVGSVTGTVERFNLRITVIRDLEGRVHFVPNSQVQQVTVFSHDWARAVIDMPVAYSQNLDRALEVFRDEVLRFYEDPEWKDYFTSAPPEVLGVQQLADNAVVLRVLFTTWPKDQWAVGREFRKRVKERFDRDGVEIQPRSLRF